VAQDSAQERTEQPTPKRRQEAREKGQIPRSRELNTVAVLMAGASSLLLFGSTLVEGFARIMRGGFHIRRGDLFDDGAGIRIFAQAVQESLLVLAPFFVVVAIVAALAPVALGGWQWSPQAIAPKFSKLDPIKGLGRIFAWRGVVELLKALAKFVVVFAGGVLLLKGLQGQFLGLGLEPLHQGLGHAVYLLAWAFLLMSATLIVVAAVDIPFQLWDHGRQLRMTRQEIRDEMKETEGKPEVRGRIRRLQQEVAQRRMMADVPKADVIITNPQHYAVALRYDQLKMAAPVVVAKGADFVAAEIRRIAGEHDITFVSAPPLARALYYSTDIGDAIPEGLYLAVARVLAYVFQLRDWMLHRRGTAKPQVPAENDLPIPDDLRRDNPHG
jgi:flagellar biosynthetic protein FlhB